MIFCESMSYLPVWYNRYVDACVLLLLKTSVKFSRNIRARFKTTKLQEANSLT